MAQVVDGQMTSLYELPPAYSPEDEVRANQFGFVRFDQQDGWCDFGFNSLIAVTVGSFLVNGLLASAETISSVALPIIVGGSVVITAIYGSITKSDHVITDVLRTAQKSAAIIAAIGMGMLIGGMAICFISSPLDFSDPRWA